LRRRWRVGFSDVGGNTQVTAGAYRLSKWDQNLVVDMSLYITAF